jgi:ribonuclease BN (tRNA processing enzyme)
MQVIILGSGTIIPCSHRRSTSLLIEWHGELILLDCGPGALDAVERTNYSYQDIRRVFLTHYHADHTLDLGRLLSAVNNDESYPRYWGVKVYGPAGLAPFVEAWQELYRSTIPKRRFLEVMEVGEGTVLSRGAASVSAVEVDHGESTALAYRVEDDGKSITYTGDTGYTGRLVELAGGTDLLVSECSFPDGHPVIGHLTPAVVGRIAAEAGVGKVVLVHMYRAAYRPMYDYQGLTEGVKRLFDGPVAVGRDGMRIVL